MQKLSKVTNFRDITSDPISPEEESLRHPAELMVFRFSVLLNFLLLAAAILLLIYGPEWTENYPMLYNNRNKIRALTIAVLTGPIFVTFLRYTRHSFVRGNSVELSKEQIPLIFNVLKRHVDKLGLLQMPGLYLSDRAISEPSGSFSTWSEDYIVLTTGYLDPKIENSHDTIAFLLGFELGRLRLGHTKFLDELLLSYVSKIPYLRNPIRHIRVYSRDRYGAFLAPEGLPGLVVQASGRRQLNLVNLDDYVQQTETYGGIVTFLAHLTKKDPPVSRRIQRLLNAGFFSAATGSDTTKPPASKSTSSGGT